MDNFSYRHRVILAIILCTVTTAMGTLNWLKKPYSFLIQKEIAENFILLSTSSEYEKAFDLTLKNTYTGQTIDEFKNQASKEVCSKDLKLVGTHPIQTNGNRLRRLLNKQEVEMSEIHVEFDGPCLFKITLRHIKNDEWKVFNFGSHAG